MPAYRANPNTAPASSNDRCRKSLVDRNISRDGPRSHHFHPLRDQVLIDTLLDSAVDIVVEFALVLDELEVELDRFILALAKGVLAGFLRDGEEDCADR